VNIRNVDLKMPVAHRLTPQPGGEAALLWALVAAVVNEGLVDAATMASRVDGYDALRASLAAYTPSAVAAATGVAWEAVRDAGRALCAAPGCAVVFGEDILRHAQGEECVRALTVFAALTGNLRGERGGIAPMRHSTNAQGAIDMGCAPPLLPGHRLAEKQGMHAAEMLAAAASGQMKALLCFGADPLTRLTDAATAAKGIDALEFLLVCELFPTATAERAQVLLPAASAFEREGTFTSFERRIQRLTSPTPAPDQARPDWQTLLALGKALGAQWDFDFPGQVFDAAAAASPTHAGLAFGMSEKPGTVWPLPDAPTRVAVAPAPRPAAPARDDEFPLALTVGVRMMDGASLTTDDPDRFGEVIGATFVEVHSDDAARLGLADGAAAEVETRHGALRAAVRVRATCAPGVLFMPRNLRVANVPALLGPGGAPCPARLRKAAS